MNKEMKKFFIITVDTEGDNLWEYIKGDEIKTQNALYIQPFQELCEKYGFKPVYLTNYEMANSEEFVSQAKKWQNSGNCEIGVHLHAWNNPPIVPLEGAFSGNPYLIEYAEDVMRQKFEYLYELIEKRFGVKPVSHRAGRWAMDDRYFKILKEFNIKVDCSFTPGVSWVTSKGVTIGGSDYTKHPRTTQWIDGVLEVPATIRRFRNGLNGSFKHRVKSLLMGEDVWMRPAMSNFSVMKRVVEMVNREDDVDFIEFMIHSSELMPNGSPYFRTEEAVKEEFRTMEAIFSYAKKCGFEGITLKEYYKQHENTPSNI